MAKETEIHFLLKEYSFKQSVIKSHQPIKYWFFNKNLFVHLTFWIWFVWVLLALFSIFLPVNNQQKLGRGAILVFESAFQYIVKKLGGVSLSEDPSSNLSPPQWNYEAYTFLYLTMALVVISAYCIFVVKNFLLELINIVSRSDRRSLNLKISSFFRFVKYLWIATALLTVWTSFALLYVSKPLDENINTIMFWSEPQGVTGEKFYYKTLTKTGWITAALNIASVLVFVLLYFKYCRELFKGNIFFFKALRAKRENDQTITIDPVIQQSIIQSFNIKPGQNYNVPNDPGYIAQLKGVNKYFNVSGGVFHALKDVNLEIKEGEFIVILGYSGSGKTTLLNVLSGIDRPTTGSCIIGGCDTTLMTNNDLNLFRRKKIGYIFQNYALLPNLTTYENIAITQNMEIFSFKEKFKNFKSAFKEGETFLEKAQGFIDVIKDSFMSKSNKKELLFLMESLNLTDHKDKLPHQLSGGQQQRVAITRALIKKPQILLADEPTGAIDHSMTKSILELFYNINKYAKTTVILITHNPLIAKMAKRVLYVSGGRIVKDVVNLKPQHPQEIQGL